MIKRVLTKEESESADILSAQIRALEAIITHRQYGFAPVEYLDDLLFPARIGERIRIVWGSEEEATPIGELPLAARRDAWEHLRAKLPREWVGPRDD